LGTQGVIGLIHWARNAGTPTAVASADTGEAEAPEYDATETGS
jgi:hypothetical protein